MLAFAIDGITSFSIKPIRMITTLGVGALGVSALMILWFIIGAVRGNTVSGWATIVVSIWLFWRSNLIRIRCSWRVYRKDLYGSKRKTAFQSGKILKVREKHEKIKRIMGKDRSSIYKIWYSWSK